MARRNRFSVGDATNLSRRRKVALIRACYRNAKEYASLSRVAHGRRLYGKAYALAALGLEQVGFTIFWGWLASDTWHSLPQKLRANLEGGSKGTSVISDHARKQDALSFSVLVLFYLYGQSAESRYSQDATVAVFKRRASRRTQLLLRAYAPIFDRMQERKFRGLYVDPEKRRLRTPWEVQAQETTRILELLRLLITLLQDDVRFPSTPLQSRRLREAREQTMRDVEEFLQNTPTATAAQIQTYGGRRREERLREATRRQRRGVSATHASREEE